MIVRKAESADIPALARLLHQVNDVHAKGRPDIFVLGQRKYSDDQLADILKDTLSPVFVAEDGDVLGYAFCVIQETSTPNLQKEKSLYIDDICVDEAARRGGVGSALWDYVNRFAAENGCRRITLNVWCLNPGAMEFYKKMGMEPLKITMEKLI
ncbi:MAG: GNAT family N-acetyltransferase [Clostridia bacterium]|nr:GNAT family N-acetyltransferase [Clostridia bacterium]